MTTLRKLNRIGLTIVILGLTGLFMAACSGQETTNGPVTSNEPGASVLAASGPVSASPLEADEPETAAAMATDSGVMAEEEAVNAGIVTGEEAGTVAVGDAVAEAAGAETGAGSDVAASVQAGAAAENEGAGTGGDVIAQFRGTGAGDGAEPGIVAVGTGKATSAPDLAILNLGVQSLAPTVGEARSDAATAMTAVIASVNEDGVEESDIQTGRFSIQPRYTGREVTRCVPVRNGDDEESDTNSGSTSANPATTGAGVPEGPSLGTIGSLPDEGEQDMAQECFQEYQSVITGYEVSNNVTVRVRDLESVDDVIDGAVEAGGDSIRFNGLTFTLEDSTELLEEARAAAVADLEDKVGQLATLSGVEVGPLVHISEAGSGSPPVVRSEFAVARVAFDQAASVSTPVSPGEVSVQTQVRGQYLISYPATDEAAGDSNQGMQSGG